MVKTHKHWFIPRRWRSTDRPCRMIMTPETVSHVKVPIPQSCPGLSKDCPSFMLPSGKRFAIS
jgi:hypothetical protein